MNIVLGRWWYVGPNAKRDFGWIKSNMAGEVNIPSNWKYWDGNWKTDKHLTVSGKIFRCGIAPLLIPAHLIGSKYPKHLVGKKSYPL